MNARHTTHKQQTDSLNSFSNPGSTCTRTQPSCNGDEWIARKKLWVCQSTIHTTKYQGSVNTSTPPLYGISFVYSFSLIYTPPHPKEGGRTGYYTKEQGSVSTSTPPPFGNLFHLLHFLDTHPSSPFHRGMEWGTGRLPWYNPNPGKESLYQDTETNCPTPGVPSAVT